MQKKSQGIVLAICVAALLLFGGILNVTPVLADSGDVLTAWASVTPVIDGAVSLGEWDDADSVEFILEYSDLQPNLSAHNATMYVKNDATYLYLAVVVELEDYNPNDFGNWMFENDNDGTIQIGDDGLSIRSDGLLTDRYRTNTIEGWWSDDVAGGGTNDMVGAVNHTNLGGLGDYTFEYRHPLDSADDIHDFSLTPGDTVGFQFQFSDGGLGGGGDLWPGLPLYGDIILAALPTHTLSLRVWDEGDNAIEEASVILDGEFKGYTNVEGELNVNNVTEGTHIILITKAGYLDKEVEVTLVSNMTLPVTLISSVNQPPEAEIISVFPSPGTVGQPVTFSFSGYDPDGTVVNYEWIWGDGTLPVSGELSGNDIPVEIDHVYAAEGDYTANLTVLDNDGAWSDMVSTTVLIEQMIEENQPPTAYIDSIEPSSAVVGDEVTFTGYGTDSDGEIVSYLWTSDIDGMLSSSDYFSTFDLSDGVHTISFQVQDDNGAWSNETTQTLVIDPLEDYEPPLIDTPSLFPEAPSEGEDVLIEVFVFDEANEVENVTLSYRVADGAWETLPMELQEGNWTVTIPEQGGGALVEFYIECYDNLGNYVASEIFSYEVERKGLELSVVLVAAAGVAAAAGTAAVVAKTGALKTGGRAISRMTRRIRGKETEPKEGKEEERRRRRKRKEKPRLVWTLAPPRKIRSGGYAYVQSEIKNVGKARATGVELKIKGPPELRFDSPLKLGDIGPNSSKEMRAKIECRKKVPEGRRSLMFTLTSNETRPQTSVRALGFESLRVGLLRDAHHISYLKKRGERVLPARRLEAWLKEKEFDYVVINEAENLVALHKYDLLVASSQYALSDGDVANLKRCLQDGRGLVVLDGVGTIDADAFLRGEPSYGGEKRVYDLYGYSRPDVAHIEKGLKGIRIIENTHPITRGYKTGTLLRLPAQTGVTFTTPVSKARMLADQRVSIKEKPGYMGVSSLTAGKPGRGRVVHFNFDVESVIGAVSPLLEKAILWAAKFE